MGVRSPSKVTSPRRWSTCDPGQPLPAFRRPGCDVLLFLTFRLKGASEEPKYGAGDGFGAPGVLCHDHIAPWKPCSFLNGLFDG
jgi:hypothetical protein